MARKRLAGLMSRNRPLRYLLAAEAVSQCGTWFNTIALLGLVYAKTSSPVMVSLVLVASSLPALLLSPVVGVMNRPLGHELNESLAARIALRLPIRRIRTR